MKEPSYDYEEYQDDDRSVDLKVLAELAVKQKQYELEITKIEERLTEYRAKLRDLSEHKFPETMDGLNLETFKTSDGLVIEVKEKVRASIPAKNKPAAFAWLQEKGQDGIIKNQLVLEFPKGEDEKASFITRVLLEMGLQPEQKRNIHSSTLASFVKTQLEEGVDFPMELFGAFRQRFTKVN